MLLSFLSDDGNEGCRLTSGPCRRRRAAAMVDRQDARGPRRVGARGDQGGSVPQFSSPAVERRAARGVALSSVVIALLVVIGGPASAQAGGPRPGPPPHTVRPPRVPPPAPPPP